MKNGRIRESLRSGSGVEFFVTVDDEVYTSSNLQARTFLGKLSGYLCSGLDISGEYDGKLGLFYNVNLSGIENVISKERCYGDRIVIEPDPNNKSFQKSKTVILSPPIVG